MRRLLLALVLSSLPSIASAQSCAEDDDLVRAASELLLEGGEPSPARVLAAARRAGSQLPVVSALVTRDPSTRRAAFLRRLGERAHAPVRCGEASSEGRVLLLAGPAAGELWVDDDGQVSADLAPGWSDPLLYARDHAGRTWVEALVSGRARLPGDLVAPVALQLVATGPDGPRPVAEHRPRLPEAVGSTEGPIEARLASLRGRRELRDNRLLARVANAHASQICVAGRVAHVDDRGDPRERLAREGIRARHVGETASRADTEAAAFDAMLLSTSHRAALEDRRFTDVGVGRATDARGRSCVVVLLAAWPRAVPYY